MVRRSCSANNPSGPLHWLKTEYIDKEAETNGVHVSFELADNPSLSKAYVDRIMRQYSGVFYRRMVLGEWVATTGSVYPNAEVSFKDPPGDPVYRYYISVDVASSGVTHAALWAEYSSGRSWALKEWRHDGQEQGQLSDASQVAKVYKALIGDKPIHEVYRRSRRGFLASGAQRPWPSQRPAMGAAHLSGRE